MNMAEQIITGLMEKRGALPLPAAAQASQADDAFARILDGFQTKSDVLQDKRNSHETKPEKETPVVHEKETKDVAENDDPKATETSSEKDVDDADQTDTATTENSDPATDTTDQAATETKGDSSDVILPFADDMKAQSSSPRPQDSQEEATLGPVAVTPPSSETASNDDADLRIQADQKSAPSEKAAPADQAVADDGMMDQNFDEFLQGDGMQDVLPGNEDVSDLLSSGKDVKNIALKNENVVHLQPNNSNQSAAHLNMIQTQRTQAAMATQMQGVEQVVSKKSAVDQVSFHIKQNLKTGSDHIKVQLHPAEMGQVDVDIEIGKDGVAKVVIAASKSDTLNWLQDEAHHLQKSLADAGFDTSQDGMSFNLKGENQQNSANKNHAGSSLGEDYAADPVAEIQVSEDMYRTLDNADGIDIRI